jgi:pimeloyl-ACP methyl ester carboxylesterase
MFNKLSNQVKSRRGWSTCLGLLAALFVVLAAGLTAALLLLTQRVSGEYFDSNGVRIHYTVEGEGEPLVLLHGFAVNADLNWRKPGITKELAGEYQVISMDLRGHGLSGKPRAANAYGEQMAEDVIHLLDHLQIEKAHVVGYSLGGFITLKLAADHPERLITASVLGAGWERPDNEDFLASIPQTVDALRSGRGIGPLSGNLGAEREKPGLLHTLWVRLMTGVFNDREALIGIVWTIPELAISEDELRNITLPVCSIVGSRDPMRVSAEALADILPDLNLVIIEGADHISAPLKAETLDALRDCLHDYR